MPAMLEELMAHPERGLLGYRMGFPTIVRYWRSFEALEAFARDPGDLHRPTRLGFFRRARDGRSGIWHETYLVRAGEYEAVHDDVPVGGRRVTAGRRHRSDLRPGTWRCTGQPRRAARGPGEPSGTERQDDDLGVL
jgi:hypothetical protein